MKGAIHTMKIPRSKLLGIFVGEEIYCTGDGPYPDTKIVLQHSKVLQISGASSGVWTIAFQSNTGRRGIKPVIGRRDRSNGRVGRFAMRHIINN
jgi:hypothetical protein